MKVITNNSGQAGDNNMPRYIQIGEWFFEVKNVRALRVDQYGKPYDAIASICINGDRANIDGLLVNEDHEFNQQDRQTLSTFCQQLGMNKVEFSGFPDVIETPKRRYM